MQSIYIHIKCTVNQFSDITDALNTKFECIWDEPQMNCFSILCKTNVIPNTYGFDKVYVKHTSINSTLETNIVEKFGLCLCFFFVNKVNMN